MRGAGAEQISNLVRTMVESKASKNVLHLFYALGYKLDDELLRVGFAFHFYKGAQITVIVTTISKMLKLHTTDKAVPVTPGIQLVEVTAPASSENYTEVVSAMSSFCEYLPSVASNYSARVKGQAYGIQSIRVDGNDALIIYSVVHTALEMAITEKRPILIEVRFNVVTGAVAIAIANPTDLVKVRLQAKGKLPPGVPRRYSGSLNAYSTIVRQEGLRALWTGLGPI